MAPDFLHPPICTTHQGEQVISWCENRYHDYCDKWDGEPPDCVFEEAT